MLSRRSSVSGPGPEEQHYIPPEMLYRPSPTQMLADADTFLYARTLFAARRLLQIWRDKAIAIKDRQAQLEEAADMFNRRKRGEAALEALSVTLQARNAARETDKFYENLYQRVAQTRVKYQTWDYFTRWFDATADAIEKTKLARYRNVMRTAWNAWYEQTVIDELKVRRFTLKRSLNMWRRRTRDRVQDDKLARAAYVQNTLHKNLISCFWEFCERRAAKLYDEKVKAKIFANMLDALAELAEREEFVQGKRAYELKSKHFHLLANKMLNIQTLEPTADDFRRRSLLARVFGEIKLQVKLQPRERQLSEQIMQSRAREALSVWRVRTEQSAMATQMDRKRILHNAFAGWNDNMRCLAMKERIDNRVVLDALRKCLLEARCALYIRVRKVRTKETLFRRWLNKLEDQQLSLARAERTFIVSQNARLKRKTLNHLRGVIDEQRQREAQALAVYEPRAINRTWPKLLSRHEHVQQLEQWGSDAEFYTVASHALKKWKESTQNSQRMRKRDAYTAVRRRVKLSTARRAFEKWRNKTSTAEFMDRQAQELQENAVLKIATRQLDHWHDRTVSVFEKAAIADDFRKEELMDRHFAVLLAKIQSISTHEEKAAALLEVHMATEASACLKKLNWRLFQVQRQEQSGYALAERNFEKHVKNMLRHWSARMHQSRHDGGIEYAPNPDAGGGQLIPAEQPFDEESRTTEDKEKENEANIARNERWTPFDSSALDAGDLQLNLNFDPNVLNPPVLQPTPAGRPLSPERPNPFAMTIRNPEAILGPPVTSTPVPGYLRSPSKRSTIRAAKARERFAALSLNAISAQTEDRPIHPLSKTVTATSGTDPSANASFDSATALSAAARTGSAAAPSYSASTFVLNTHTGTTTPLAAPTAFSSFDSPGTTQAADTLALRAPGTAPAAMTAADNTAFIVPSRARGVRTRNFGASTMLAGTPGPATNKAVITPFARKLTAQGFSASGSARGSESARSRQTRGYGSVGLGLAGFGGFEDIAEDESQKGSKPRDSSPRGDGGKDSTRQGSRESSP
ncbi:Sfi1 spindle body [Macrophomina phaseolina MS6]|uniref:Sfi1 spindle body n=1 Tax=Macrophomina phaseolina (strain MS6) TaxID=1126212 RepID=K2RSG8_MACPH|nr:Sfi1 spindle body [Macrophomina phaseolina MS6]